MELITRDEYCSGCRVCQGVCVLENFREINPSKAALSIEGLFPAPGKYKINVCNQCGVCAENCPVGAIHLVNGVYLINDEECTGCMVCVDVCPRKVMFSHKSIVTPFKCTLCGECAKLCPREALILKN